MSDNNPIYTSYLWLIALLVLAFLICIFIRSPDRQKINEDITEPTVEKVVQQTPKELKLHNINSHLDTNSRSLYDQLSPNINTAINQLQQKSREAKRIIAYFPDFPNIWLLPPKTKEGYASIPERYCIEFLHLLFPGYNFIKQKHSWLRNTKTNYPLELDGYCSDLMIAIEYNGIQHYVWPNFFHSTIDDFFSQRDRDQIKVEICIEKNICLIRIPYTVPKERIPLAIYAKLLEAVPGLEF
jgi:hypothetical protein